MRHVEGPAAGDHHGGEDHPGSRKTATVTPWGFLDRRRVSVRDDDQNNNHPEEQTEELVVAGLQETREA